MPLKPPKHSALSRLTARAREETGMAVVVAISMLSVTLVFTLTAFAAVWGDIPLAKGDQDRKQAYTAAEAGVSYYQYHLDQDNNYWTKCTNVPPPSTSEPSPVNQAWSGAGTDPRNWRTILDSNAQYTIELLPAPGFTQCEENNAASMLDPATNTFRIRATGRAGNAKRSIVATFKRKGFLDYLYFTDYETADPLTYATLAAQSVAARDCGNKYHYQNRPSSCTEIRFADDDEVAGPLHSNDSILMCGTPTFGRSPADSIESSDTYWEQGGCNANPNFVGTWKPNSQPLPLPMTNSSLQSLTQNNYRYTGTTTIRLTGTTMTVTNANLSPSTQTGVALPSNGLIYVRNGTCGVSYDRQQLYDNPAGCADVYLSGNFSKDLTIASENDIIVKPPTGSTNGDIISSSNALLGLIPNNFVRVYHPGRNWNGSDCDNATGTMTNVRIDAAILALNHSFIVDNYYCGANLGTLTVNGAIAQKYRGPVGTGGSGGGSGYTKDYNYEDNLQYRDPPSFLTPTQSTWTVRRFVEQSPAR